MSLPLDPGTAIRWTVALAGVGLLQASLESLANWRIYKRGHWLSWDHLKKSRPFFHASPLVDKSLNWLFQPPVIYYLFSAQVLISAGLVSCTLLGYSNSLSVALTFAMTFMAFLLGWRNTYSNNGSDQVTKILLIPSCIYLLSRGDPWISMLSIFFIACQSELSYLTSGFFKLLEADWRNGQSLRAIFSTSTFGNPHLKQWMDAHPNSYKVGSLFVIFGELFLGCAFAFPPPICLTLLAVGLFFHLGTAVVMGLNTFVWAFAATYPSVYFISLMFH